MGNHDDASSRWGRGDSDVSGLGPVRRPASEGTQLLRRTRTCRDWQAALGGRALFNVADAVQRAQRGPLSGRRYGDGAQQRAGLLRRANPSAAPRRNPNLNPVNPARPPGEHLKYGRTDDSGAFPWYG